MPPSCHGHGGTAEGGYLLWLLAPGSLGGLAQAVRSPPGTCPGDSSDLLSAASLRLSLTEWRPSRHQLACQRLSSPAHGPPRRQRAALGIWNLPRRAPPPQPSLLPAY